MGALVRAEFRKIFTLNLWWGLLIPVALLSLGAGWLGSSLSNLYTDVTEQAGVTTPEGSSLPIGLLTVSMATNYSTIFAGLFGALAISGEHRNKSITTTYLTGNPRGAVLGSKLIVYANFGLLYGLTNVVFASLGGLFGAGFNGFSNPIDWFVICAAGMLAMVLWTLLGVGFGALITSSTVAIIVLLIYRFAFEFIISLTLIGSDLGAVKPFLPNAAASGIVGNLAVPKFITAVAGPSEPMIPKEVFEGLHFVFGGSYEHPWWGSLLTFIGYAALFICGGWLISRQRDIT